MIRPTANELVRWLASPLADALGDRFGRLELSLLSQADTVADGTSVLLLRDAARQPRAVVLCSSPAAPEMVDRAVSRARKAKAILDASTGSAILDPLAEGHIEGLSYAVMPYCSRLSDSRPVWWIQRAMLSRPTLDWLWRVTGKTVHAADLTAIERSFAEPLAHMASLGFVTEGLRLAARQAAMRLGQGAWKPRQVLMHGDLWKGNFLIQPRSSAGDQRKWRDRFAIIDWAGSAIDGYPILDLVRLAQSVKLDAGSSRNEVERHCRLLECEPSDASSYLVSALGHIAMNLEYFPKDMYISMAESCHATLARISN